MKDTSTRPDSEQLDSPGMSGNCSNSRTNRSMDYNSTDHSNTSKNKPERSSNTG